MKKNLTILVFLAFSFVFQNCGSVKVRDAWTAEEETVAKFKEKKILVLARTADNTSRIAFEEALVNELKANNYKATESFKSYGYPGYYGGFNNYYRTPYAYGSYYNSFGGYIPTSTSTSTSTTYILETVFYNLDEPEENQLVAVVTSELDDPKEAYKTAQKYVETMVKAFED